MRFINATLILFRNIMIKNYQNLKLIIDLLFAIITIIKQLKFYEIFHEMKNSFDHLFINTIFDLRA